LEVVIESGSILTLDIEKPAAGGRMLARHHGQVVLVWGGIPGERVSARIERTGKGLAYAETVEVLVPSPDRRPVMGDWRCGGNVLAHVNYPRQLHVKGQIIQDAFGRIGRVPLPAVPEVIGSPEAGYRMRARLHVGHGRLGFYREGTHQLCEAAQAAQLLPATHAWIAHAEQFLRDGALSGLAGVEIAENIAGDQRACHLDLHADIDPAPFAALAEGLVGLSAQRADQQTVQTLAGTPAITDILNVRQVRLKPDTTSLDVNSDVVSGFSRTDRLQVRRDVRSFFQGNRFLLERLVHLVTGLIPSGPVVDLYAGVGLFGLSLAAAGVDPVTLVEGDPISGADLKINAQPFAGRVRVERKSVEHYLTALQGKTRPAHDVAGATFIVDPPRTGMTRDALAGIIRATPSRIVYVSCDVATLARDTRTLLDAGYRLEQLTGIDLFPNTAHVESIALFTR
jgi:23S rRNA (uracil1939-C5)-methyltransferase